KGHTAGDSSTLILPGQSRVQKEKIAHEPAAPITAGIPPALIAPALKLKMTTATVPAGPTVPASSPALGTIKSEKRTEWQAHIWEGIDASAWLRLLAANRFAVHWSLWYVALIVSVVSIGHTFLRCL